jgi:hypothetical protein
MLPDASCTPEFVMRPVLLKGYRSLGAEAAA